LKIVDAEQEIFSFTMLSKYYISNGSLVQIRRSPIFRRLNVSYRYRISLKS